MVNLFAIIAAVIGGCIIGCYGTVLYMALKWEAEERAWDYE